MKKIGISMRVDIINSYQERRDSIDQRWCELLLSLGYEVIYLPNNIDLVGKQLKLSSLNGIILTGGNDLVKYKGNAPERDETEHFLITSAMKLKIPILGVCRGMQVIADYFGMKLERVDGHVATNHEVTFLNKTYFVNSYHSYGIRTLNERFKELAISIDNFIEAFKHNEYDIYGIMWHPERNKPYEQLDIDLLTEVFG